MGINDKRISLGMFYMDAEGFDDVADGMDVSELRNLGQCTFRRSQHRCDDNGQYGIFSPTDANSAL